MHSSGFDPRRKPHKIAPSRDGSGPHLLQGSSSRRNRVWVTKHCFHPVDPNLYASFWNEGVFLCWTATFPGSFYVFVIAYIAHCMAHRSIKLSFTQYAFFDEMFCDYTALITLIYSFVFCCMRCIGLIKCLHILAQDKSVSSFLRQL